MCGLGAAQLIRPSVAFSSGRSHCWPCSGQELDPQALPGHVDTSTEIRESHDHHKNRDGLISSKPFQAVFRSSEFAILDERDSPAQTRKTIDCGIWGPARTRSFKGLLPRTAVRFSPVVGEFTFHESAFGNLHGSHRPKSNRICPGTEFRFRIVGRSAVHYR